MAAVTRVDKMTSLSPLCRQQNSNHKNWKMKTETTQHEWIGSTSSTRLENKIGNLLLRPQNKTERNHTLGVVRHRLADIRISWNVRHLTTIRTSLVVYNVRMRAPTTYSLRLHANIRLSESWIMYSNTLCNIHYLNIRNSPTSPK